MWDLVPMWNLVTSWDLVPMQTSYLCWDLVPMLRPRAYARLRAYARPRTYVRETKRVTTFLVRVPPITFTRMFEPRHNILSNVRVRTFENMLWRGSNICVKAIGGTRTSLSGAQYISYLRQLVSAGNDRCMEPYGDVSICSTVKDEYILRSRKFQNENFIKTISYKHYNRLHWKTNSEFTQQESCDSIKPWRPRLNQRLSTEWLVSDSREGARSDGACYNHGNDTAR